LPLLSVKVVKVKMRNEISITILNLKNRGLEEMKAIEKKYTKNRRTFVIN